MLNSRLIKTGLLVFFLCLGFFGNACEIHFEVSEKYQKEIYKAGDEIVLEVKIVFDHRDCHTDISETKFTASGAKIMGATKWSQSNANTYHRKLKVRILADNKSAMNVICKRTCNKEGGLGKITLTKE